MLSPIFMNNINFGNNFQRKEIKTPEIKVVKPESENNEIQESNKTDESKPTPRKLGTTEFAAGLLMGFFIGSASLGIQRDNLTAEMVKDIQENSQLSEQPITLKDVTNDGIPEFLVKDKNGKTTAFDFMTYRTFADYQENTEKEWHIWSDKN